jgi:hypothetical protein
VLAREEHLRRAKVKALRYAADGRFEEALAAMEAELLRHPDLRGHPWMERGLIQMARGGLRTVEEVVAYVEGFH